MSGTESRECLWPAGLRDVSADSACRFLFDHVQTVEDVTLSHMSVPRKRYLEDVVGIWHECLASGRPVHFEKSRRLIVSWVMKALEIHLLGCRPGRVLTAARVYEGITGSLHFVWRGYAIYDRLRERCPEWKLPECQPFGSVQSKQIRSLVLPNASVMEAVNSQGESFRGGGATVAGIEELSQFARAKALWGQAIKVCEPPPGRTPGLAYSINNASPNYEWQEIKAAATT